MTYAERNSRSGLLFGGGVFRRTSSPASATLGIQVHCMSHADMFARPYESLRPGTMIRNFLARTYIGGQKMESLHQGALRRAEELSDDVLAVERTS
jgi:hypothetical protein